jgi:hypothetical protein
MRIPGRHRRALRRIDGALRRSDPELASMFAEFARLSDGEGMPAPERPPAPEASGWYMMPWPMASGFLAIWAAAGLVGVAAYSELDG